MPNTGDKIRQLRKRRGLSLRGLAALTGMSRTHLSALERSERRINEEVLGKIADALGVDIGEFFDRNLKLIGLRYIPLHNRVPAGDPKEYTDGDYPAGDAEEFVPCPEDLTDKTAFALRVEGNSMEPRFKEGDIVIVSPYSELKGGAPVVYRLKNGDCAVKNYHQGGNGEIILCPENLKTGGVQVFQPTDFAWIYPVVKSQRDEYH